MILITAKAFNSSYLASKLKDHSYLAANLLVHSSVVLLLRGNLRY